MSGITLRRIAELIDSAYRRWPGAVDFHTFVVMPAVRGDDKTAPIPKLRFAT